ncbi:MAG: ADP-ribosylglycohydrolase family protein [Phycisphaerales bacterium]
MAIAVADASAARFEGGIAERTLWAAIGHTRAFKRRWTDDTQMTLDTARSLVRCGAVDQDDLAREYAGNRRWSRGYGPAAAKTLRHIARGTSWRKARFARFPNGSFGNGAAMRVAPVALSSRDDQGAVIAGATAVGEITHAHPLAIGGAIAVALAVHAAARGDDAAATVEASMHPSIGPEHRERLEVVRAWGVPGERPALREVRRRLGNGMAAVESCATAIWLATASYDRSLTDLIRDAIGLRGDTDTIAAMAAGIWGARHGEAAVPQAEVERTEAAEDVRTIASELAARFAPGDADP